MVRQAFLAIIALSIVAAAPDSPAASPTLGLVFFTKWSALLDDSALAVIQRSATAANAAEEPRLIIVTGFADVVGSNEANKMLSATRAQVVVDQLVADGIASKRIKKVADGATQDIGGTNESRRVVISLQ